MKTRFVLKIHTHYENLSKKRKIDESYDMKFNQCNENLLKFWKRHPFNAHLSL